MAYVATDGPPDVDATHTWAPAAGTPPPVLNDQGGGVPNALSWLKLIAIDGWRDLPEMLDNRAPRTFGVGEVPYPSRVLGKTVVYQLQARGVTREEAQGLVSGCLNGFGASMSDEGIMTVTPHATPGGVAWTFAGRVIAIDADSTFTLARGVLAPYRWGLTVSIRMSNPHFYTSAVGYL